MTEKVVIGNCTLYCGDAVEVLSMLPGKTVDCVVTDPPYGMEFRSNHRTEKHKKIKGDDDITTLRWTCGLNANHSKYAFCRWDNLNDIPKPRSLITWVKNNWSMGDLKHEHGRQTECIAFYPGPRHQFPKKRPTDVIKAPRTDNTFHPTEKPVQLMIGIIEWTQGVVFDPFMGSGSTGVACVRLGRPFVGIEIDRQYFDIACKRIRDAHSQPELFINEYLETENG